MGRRIATVKDARQLLGHETQGRMVSPLLLAAPVDQTLLDELRRETGLRVVPVPRLSEISTQEAPRRGPKAGKRA